MIGKKIIFKNAIESTNNYIANLIRENKIEQGTVILSDEQLNGKGQRGAKWDSEPSKNIIFSCYVEHDNLTVQNQFQLNKLVSLACIDFLNEFQKGFQIKWPNDIIYKTSKIAGILIENHIEGNKISKSIIGIGININQLEFGPYNATSLSIICKKSFDIKTLSLILIEKLNLRIKAIKQLNQDSIQFEYLNNLWLFNITSNYSDEDGEFKGKIIGTNDVGQLLIETKNTIKVFNNKEVVFLERIN